MNNAGKVAVITGGGSGIGLATASRLLQDGYETYTFGLGEPEQRVEGIHYQDLDVSDGDAVETYFSRFERIHALVNAAGTIDHKGEWEVDGFSSVLAVNLTSVLRVCSLALPALKAGHGSVVNFASMWAYFGSPKTPAYAASKTAICGLTRSMAVAWAKDCVRVNAVAPGWIMTNLSRKAYEDPERYERIVSRIPMERWGAPDDVADVIAFLVSDSSRYVTGVTIPIDGGYSVC